MRFRSSRYVSCDEIRTNLNRYNQKVNRQKRYEESNGDWDDRLDPETRARMMGKESHHGPNKD
jgi:hypothetical protein